LDRLIGPAKRDWNDYLKRVVAREDEVTREAKAKRDQVRRQSTPPRPLIDYVGAYEHPAIGECTISEAGGALKWMWQTRSFPTIWDTGDQFHVEFPGLREPAMVFEIAGGKVGAPQ